jgi:hypothetical protein
LSRFDYKDPVITRRRTGDSEDPYIDITEPHQIEGSVVNLTEIPYEMERVTVTGANIQWFEAENDEDELQENEYIVDYVNGLVKFHISQNGKQLQFKYKGAGLRYIPISMIYTKATDGQVSETLSSLITDSQQALNDTLEVANDINRGELTREQNEQTRQQQESERQSQEEVRNEIVDQAIDRIDTAASKIINIWKPYINSFSEINTVYPSPSEGWTTQAKDTGIRYRYSNGQWVAIEVASTTGTNQIIVANVPPSNTNLIWIDTSK